MSDSNPHTSPPISLLGWLGLMLTIVVAAVAMVVGLAIVAPRPTVLGLVGVAIVPLVLLGVFVAALLRLLADGEREVSPPVPERDDWDPAGGSDDLHPMASRPQSHDRIAA
jgi:hypothetical protein